MHTLRIDVAILTSLCVYVLLIYCEVHGVTKYKLSRNL